MAVPLEARSERDDSRAHAGSFTVHAILGRNQPDVEGDATMAQSTLPVSASAATTHSRGRRRYARPTRYAPGSLLRSTSTGIRSATVPRATPWERPVGAICARRSSRPRGGLRRRAVATDPAQRAARPQPHRHPDKPAVQRRHDPRRTTSCSSVVIDDTAALLLADTVGARGDLVPHPLGAGPGLPG